MSREIDQMHQTADDTTIVPLRSDDDVVRLRLTVRECLVSLGFSLIEQTKTITAASELARNTLSHGGGGESHVTKVSNGGSRGVRLSFIDRGPGIADVGLALTNGYSTGSGLGLGLGGAKRLSDEFDLKTEPGKGTTVVITKWKAF
jgi:serine/threonine-protein kinase RsbT